MDLTDLPLLFIYMVVTHFSQSLPTGSLSIIVLRGARRNVFSVEVINISVTLSDGSVDQTWFSKKKQICQSRFN